ncbi:MAG: 4Fe-4S cluster-binding domain-containing protein, partial [Cetobacterium somerae]
LSLIELCDILVDGKFRIEEKDLNLKWRGSKNQRVINIKKSLELKETIKYID